MLSKPEISPGKAIHKRTGSTFYVATRLLPRRIRHPTYVFYGFFRTADQVVDDPAPATPADQRERLEEIEAAVLGEVPTDEPALAAMDTLRREADLPEDEIVEFLSSMKQDIDTNSYQTYADLEQYMRGSAVAVGNLMLAIMKPTEYDAAVPHAAALSNAFQMTNFLRDVREDIQEYDRVYLPTETLARFDVDREQLTELEQTHGFKSAVCHEMERTEQLYRDGVAGIEYLPRDCQFPVVLAAILYAEHHRWIRFRDYDVLSQPVEIPTYRYPILVAQTWVLWQLIGDPVEVFYRVSPISPQTSEPTDEASLLATGTEETRRIASKLVTSLRWQE